jgi:serine/threonine-protein kinase RsbT
LSKERAQITAVLTKHVSQANVRVILRQTFGDGPAPTGGIAAEERGRVLSQMERCLALFLPARERDAALAELRATLASEAQSVSIEPGPPQVFQVHLESDISIVRSEARRIVEAMGASGFGVQKVVTIVSELARNMVSYAGGGVMTLASLAPPNRGIAIKAKDTGSGIPNLALVMSGNYKSRTGLGRGLVGCKRLADKFSLASDSSGTRIEAEVKICKT